MLLLRRFLPAMTAFLVAACLFWQVRAPATYPWLSIAGPVLFLFAGLFIAVRRVSLRDLTARLLPSTLALAGAAYALVIAEGATVQWLLPAFSGVIAYFALELLFLLAFLPARYPVNGLSRLNVAVVPAVFWFANDASVGLSMFIHAPRFLSLIVLTVAGMLLFWSTEHADATDEQRWRWSAIGGWVGAQLGMLGAFLPVSIGVHGGYAALIGALVLRARRYGMSPQLPRTMMWGEVTAGFVLLVVMLATAKWV